MSLCRRVLLQDALQLNRRGSLGTRRFLSTPPAYPGHIPLNAFEKTVLFAGAGIMSLLDPRRGGRCGILVLTFGFALIISVQIWLLLAGKHQPASSCRVYETICWIAQRVEGY